VAEPQKLSTDGLVDVLVEGEGGPLVLAWEEEGIRRLHVAFDPARSTWPWDPTFITFLADGVDWLARRGHAAGVALPVGSTMAVTLPEGVSAADLVSPDGDVRSVQVGDGRQRVAWGPVEQAGVWLLTWDEPTPGHLAVAVAGAAAAEGDLSHPPAQVFGAVEALVQIEQGTVPLWPWALLVTLIVLVIEWAMYCRRIA